MKKYLVLFIILSTLVSLYTEEITVAGSGTNESILKVLANAYVTSNPGNTINVPPSIGNDGGINGCVNDKFVLGRIGRPLKENEKKLGLTELLFCKIPVVFIVNEKTNIKNLTSSQICDIYSGKITNWKEVGGEDKKIYVITRDKGDSSFVEIGKKVDGFNSIAVSERSILANSDPEMIEKVEGKDGTIGFGTIANMRGRKVKVLSLDNINPNKSSYKMLLTVGLIHTKPLTGLARNFVDFIYSPKGSEIITNLNCIPIKLE